VLDSFIYLNLYTNISSPSENFYHMLEHQEEKEIMLTGNLVHTASAVLKFNLYSIFFEYCLSITVARQRDNLG
jgi:hypothetical protein